MKFFDEENITPTPWTFLLAYTAKTKSASLYINKNDGSLHKYYFKDPRSVGVEILQTSMEDLKKQMLNKKDIEDVPFFKEYQIDALKGDILIGVIKMSLKADGCINSDYFMGKTAIVVETRELDWIKDRLADVNFSVEDFMPTPKNYSFCSIS